MIKCYVIHVSTDKGRECHIKNQLANRDLDVHFINEGDKENIPQNDRDLLFKGDTLRLAQISCAYKHILAYRQIIQDNVDIALVLEDDIFLDQMFDIIFPKVISEIKHENFNCFIVSIEDSTLDYVSKSEQKNGKLLYLKDSGRTAGAYIIDHAAAKKILDVSQQRKISRPIDHFINLCIGDGLLSIYWLHPPIATQGSHNGRIASLIDARPLRLLSKCSFRLEKIYKKYILRYLR